MDAFLTPQESSQIRQMYKKWLDNLKPNEFATSLFTRNLIQDREKQKYDALKTVYEKNELLFGAALQRTTYDRLCKVREALVDTEQEELARLLPVRSGDYYWDDLRQGRARKRQIEEGGTHQMEIQRENNDTGSQSHFRKPASTTQTEAHRKQETNHNGQLKRGDNQPYTMMTESDVSTMPAAQPDHPKKPALPSYGIKANDHPNGKGYCLIIANYTTNLKGYNTDIENITHFFRDVLGYTVRTEKNLKREVLMNVLKETRSELDGSNNYDRLFVFVLSHGSKEGIQTCKSNGNSEEDEYIDGCQQFVQPEDVVSLFRHDKLPSLKDFPKAFFFQVCRGKEFAQAAGDDTGATAEGMQDDLAECAAGADKITIGADTLVCFASPNGYYSWVDQDKGSWLIEEAISVFKDYYQSEHLVDMITEINRRITRKTQPSKVLGRKAYVYQIPSIKHNLTCKFFLCNYKAQVQ